MGGCRFIAVTGMKGGVGKTTACVNFASSLTSLSRKVVVVEADVATPDLADTLRLDVSGKPTLSDVLGGKARVFDAVTEADNGVHVLPVGDPRRAAAEDVSELSRLVRLLSHQYDLVLIDAPPAMGYGAVPALEAADESVVVTTPRLPSVHSSKRTADTATRYGAPVNGVLVNHAATGRSPKGARIAEFIGSPLLAEVPYADRVTEACDRGEAIVLSAPENPAAKAFRRAAKTMIDTEPPQRSGRKGKGRGKKRS